AALPAFPAVRAAKAPPPPHPPAAGAAAQPSAQSAASTPQDHLRLAKAALDGIEPASLSAPAKSQITELRRHLMALERESTASAAAKATPAQGANAKWATEVAAIDRIVTGLVGGDPAAPGTPVGTSGTAPRSKAATLDDAAKSKLLEVRTHITAFAAGMSGTTEAPAAAAAPAPA